MKILVTGATGFIGKRVCEQLYQKGHSVVVASRSGEAARSKFPFPVLTVNWDAKNPFPTVGLEGIHAVIHFAGEGVADRRWTSERKKQIYDSRIKGTRHLVDTILASKSPPPVFVSTSAIGIYGDRGEEILSETSSPGDGFLAEVCRDWEKETARLPSSVRLAIVRVGIVLGIGGGALKKLLPIFKLGIGGPVGNGKQWMSWIHVDDVAALFVDAALNSSVIGVLNGVAPTPVTNADFSKALGRTLHRPAILPAPAFALKLAMGELSTLVLSSQHVLPQATQKIGFTYQFPTLNAALENLVKNQSGT